MQERANRETGRTSSALALLVAALLAVGLSSCRFSTQRWPGPMRAEVDPLPPGARYDYAPGPEPVLVYRHADPVSVARAGDVAGFPMSFHRKVERLTSGSWLAVGAGGRAEVLWPSDATSVRIYDRCYAVVGEPSRDEPTLVFQTLTRARLNLTPEDRISLMGGAILRGDEAEESGPFLIERLGEEILRIRNQSKKVMFVDYRRRELAVAPGSLVDLPLLPIGEGGTAPELPPTGIERMDRNGLALETRGQVETRPYHDAWVMRAQADSVVEALGLAVTLLPGERVVVGGLGEPPPALSAGAPAAEAGPAMQPNSRPADTDPDPNAGSSGQDDGAASGSNAAAPPDSN